MSGPFGLGGELARSRQDIDGGQKSGSGKSLGRVVGKPPTESGRYRTPHGARVRSSGPGSSASSAANPHSPPPGWLYPAPGFAACIPLPRVGRNPAAVRNCAAAESIRNRWDRFSCPAPAPAPVAVCPPAAPAKLALLTPRVEQSNKLPCFPSPLTLPDVPSSPLPGAAILPSSLRSWLFLDRSHPASEHTPSAAHSPDRFPTRCDE